MLELLVEPLEGKYTGTRIGIWAGTDYMGCIKVWCPVGWPSDREDERLCGASPSDQHYESEASWLIANLLVKAIKIEQQSSYLVSEMVIEDPYFKELRKVAAETGQTGLVMEALFTACASLSVALYRTFRQAP